MILSSVSVTNSGEFDKTNVLQGPSNDLEYPSTHWIYQSYLLYRVIQNPFWNNTASDFGPLLGAAEHFRFTCHDLSEDEREKKAY